MKEYISKSDLLAEGWHLERFRNVAPHMMVQEQKKIEDYPAAEAVEKSKYDELFKAACAMHEWIFLHTLDEEEVYKECGLSEEMNRLLGSLGSTEFVIHGGEE